MLAVTVYRRRVKIRGSKGKNVICESAAYV